MFSPVQTNMHSYAKMFLYGVTNTGKTHFALTAADVEELSPVLFLSADNNASYLAGHPNVDMFELESMREIRAWRNQLIKVNKEKTWENYRFFIDKDTWQHKAKGYKTIIIDSFTGLQTRLLTDLAKTTEEKVQIQHYLEANNAIVSLFTQLSKMPIHLIVTGHIDTSDMIGMKKNIFPSSHGKIGLNLARLFFQVGYVEREMTTKGDLTTITFGQHDYAQTAARSLSKDIFHLNVDSLFMNAFHKSLS